ncbi:MAG: helix-turn-helix domain-containing protein [Patescibacteria group bacterium]
MNQLEQALYAVVRSAVVDALRELGSPRAAEPEPDLVKVGEVRRYIRVSASTLKKWIRSGELAKYGKGRMALVRLNEVRAVLKQRAAPVPAEPGGRATAIVASLARRRAG